MLYKRDYTLLTDEERRGWDRAEKMIRSKTEFSASDMVAYGNTMPSAGWYYMQLFPNNYLFPDELKDRERLCGAKEGLLRILDDPQAGEREILNFVRDNEYYFLVGSLFLRFDFGHHEAFLFREFPLGTEHVADYLLVGKNSGGYEFVFVEFESPRGAITTRTGDFGDAIRKGISQAKDWSRWLDANFPTLHTRFERAVGRHRPDLPKEFYKSDRSRRHYVVVAGRRADYNEKTYALRRELAKENGILLLHYDNLLDSLDELAGRRNY